MVRLTFVCVVQQLVSIFFIFNTCLALQNGNENRPSLVYTYYPILSGVEWCRTWCPGAVALGSHLRQCRESSACCSDLRIWCVSEWWKPIIMNMQSCSVFCYIYGFNNAQYLEGLQGYFWQIPSSPSFCVKGTGSVGLFLAGVSTRKRRICPKDAGSTWVFLVRSAENKSMVRRAFVSIFQHWVCISFFVSQTHLQCLTSAKLEWNLYESCLNEICSFLPAFFREISKSFVVHQHSQNESPIWAVKAFHHVKPTFLQTGFCTNAYANAHTRTQSHTRPGVLNAYGHLCALDMCHNSQGECNILYQLVWKHFSYGKSPHCVVLDWLRHWWCRWTSVVFCVHFCPTSIPLKLHAHRGPCNCSSISGFVF